MSTARSNKATFSRLHDAVNSGDLEVIAKTIDEVVEPEMLFHASVPMGMSGAQALKQVWAVLLRAFPDIHVAVEDVIAEGDKVVFRNSADPPWHAFQSTKSARSQQDYGLDPRPTHH
ncbi:ester cyclase [Nocardia sp. NPDC049526]|uniref:ester cyclase n=1 Tax=Nocardia sp. NPDC049526 TaxID=3364316 RepID=UPI0037BD7EC6